MLIINKLFYQKNNFQLNCDLTLNNGRYVLLAPSGSGKTTFLEILAGFLSPTTGEIFLQKQNISQLKPKNRPISYLFQNNNLFDHLTVKSNLALVNKNIDDILQALNNVQLPASFLNKLPTQLSGGEQQRVALARTLLQKNRLVLLDEPFSALDWTVKQKICALTIKLQQKQQFMLIAVSHDPNDINNLQSNQLTIENQQLIQK